MKTHRCVTDVLRDAVLSPCGTYRYSLSRDWAEGAGLATFVMLNPSTATHEVDDPTIRKCIGFARRWGHCGIRVVNLFALRSTDPRGLLAHPAPVGPENDEHIASVIDSSCLTIVAWGAFNRGALGKLVRARVRHVAGNLALLGANTQCLGRARNGSPLHPLMLAYAQPRELWRHA